MRTRRPRAECLDGNPGRRCSAPPNGFLESWVRGISELSFLSFLVRAPAFTPRGPLVRLSAWHVSIGSRHLPNIRAMIL